VRGGEGARRRGGEGARRRGCEGLRHSDRAHRRRRRTRRDAQRPWRTRLAAARPALLAASSPSPASPPARRLAACRDACCAAIRSASDVTPSPKRDARRDVRAQNSGTFTKCAICSICRDTVSGSRRNRSWSLKKRAVGPVRDNLLQLVAQGRRTQRGAVAGACGAAARLRPAPLPPAHARAALAAGRCVRDTCVRARVSVPSPLRRVRAGGRRRGRTSCGWQ